MSEPLHYYVDRKTKTIWCKDNNQTVPKGKKWYCGLCAGDLEICRGCGGMSRMYPNLFGSCGTYSVCPNCMVFLAPQDWKPFDGEFHYCDITEFNEESEGPYVSYYPEIVDNIEDF
jgi:hypothetical protein